MPKHYYNVLCGTVTCMIFVTQVWLLESQSQKHSFNQCTTAFTQVMLQSETRSPSEETEALHPTPMPSRLGILQSVSLPPEHHEEEQIPIQLLCRRSHWKTCFRENTSSSEAGCPTTVPRKWHPRKWLFSERQLIGRRERTVHLLYSIKENIKLCHQYMENMRCSGLQPGKCLAEEMVQYQMYYF